MGTGIQYPRAFGRSCALLLLGFLVLCLAPAAHARIMREMTYQERFDKSDLIVIAHPATKTTDTKERTFFPDIATVNPDRTKTKDPAIGVETVFDILAVLKGTNPGKQFVLHHYREPNAPPSAAIVMGGPQTVSFNHPDSGRAVLLFLVKESDGRYAPYGGQTDPGITAIFGLGEP